MLAKYYTNDVMSPYFNLFNIDPFKLADEIYGTRYSDSSYRTVTDDTGLTLSIDVPGVKSKDITVNVEGRKVKVSGVQRGKDFVHTYNMSRNYDVESVEATLEDGVLSLRFSKNEDAKPRLIPITVK